MTVYRDKRSPYFRYDFQIGGQRFQGTTKATIRREAEVVENRQRQYAKLQIEHVKGAAGSLALKHVSARWLEAMRPHVRPRSHEKAQHDIAVLIEFFGPDKLISEIGDLDIERLIAWRRTHKSCIHGKLVGPFTVNDTTGTLKSLFIWLNNKGVHFPIEPDWKSKSFWLKEPKERCPRELVGDEGARLDARTRDDYRPFFDFLRATGMRWNCEVRTLRWSQVNFGAGQIVRIGKGDRVIAVPLTSMVREILLPLVGNHPEFVFTYVARKTREGRVRGQHYPLTRGGVNKVWFMLRAAAGMTDFRLHDFRHDFGTKFLRRTGNLKLVSQAMNHSDIKMTTRYAHVLDADVANALESFHRDQTRPDVTATLSDVTATLSDVTASLKCEKSNNDGLFRGAEAGANAKNTTKGA